MMRRIIALVALLTALAACDRPDEACTEEGKKKHYSTGKILSCEGGKWVLRDGVGFTR